MNRNNEWPYYETPGDEEDDFLGNLFWENKLPWDPKATPDDLKDDFYDDVESDGPEWWETEDIAD